MSEAWRVKRYYRPRVLMPVADVLDNPYPGRLVFLTGAETNLLRNLLQYAHRRSTFVDAYQPTTYLAPTEAQWDSIQAVVAEVEGKLMTDCCQDILDALATISGKLDTTNTELSTSNARLLELDGAVDALAVDMGEVADTMPGLLTAAQCVCEKDFNLTETVVVPPDWENIPNSDLFFQWGSATPDTTIASQAEADACALAQAWYAGGYEFLSEWMLPALRFGFDKVLPAACAALAAWTGGLAAPALLGVYALAELIQELLELGYDSAESNLVNWTLAAKDDIICPLYQAIHTGTSGHTAWAGVQADVVQPAVELSATDKQLIQFAFGIVAPAPVRKAQEENTAWFQTQVTPGYCSVCTNPPIIGSNWVAVPISEEDGYIQLVTGPTSLIHACWQYPSAPGLHTCGWVLEVVGNTNPPMNLQAWPGVDNGCGGNANLCYSANNQVSSLGKYYISRWQLHEWPEAVAALCPGATVYQQCVDSLGPKTVSLQIHDYHSDRVTTWTAYMRYVVYAGTTPP